MNEDGEEEEPEGYTRVLGQPAWGARRMGWSSLGTHHPRASTWDRAHGQEAKR